MGPPPAQAATDSEESLTEEMLEELYALLDQYHEEDASQADCVNIRDSISALLGSESCIISTTA